MERFREAVKTRPITAILLVLTLLCGVALAGRNIQGIIFPGDGSMRLPYGGGSGSQASHGSFYLDASGDLYLKGADGVAVLITSVNLQNALSGGNTAADSVNFAEIAAPSSAANIAKIYSEDDDGVTRPVALLPGGVKSFLDEGTLGGLHTGQWGYVSASGDPTTLDGVGLFAPNVIETDASSSAQLDANGVAFRQSTSTATNNSATWQSFNFTTQLETNARILIKFRLVSNSDVRFWLGLVNGSAAQMGADAPNVNYIGIQYSTNRGDTTFWFIAGTDSSNQTLADSTVAVDTAVHTMQVVATGSTSLLFKLFDADGVQEGIERTINTNLPTATNMAAGGLVQNLASSAKSADLFFCEVVHAP
jgi:hypothetical protein